MAFYILLGILLLILCFAEYYSIPVDKKIVRGIIFLTMWITAAIRYDVGSDFLSYVDFLNIPEGVDTGIEPVYLLIKEGIRQLYLPQQFFFGITSGLILWFFFKGLEEHAEYWALSLLLFCFLGLYTSSMNVLRQFIAVAIYFWLGLRYIYQANFLKYLLTCLFAAVFHYSAVLMIPVYFLVRTNIKPVWIIILCIVAILFNLGLINTTFIFKILFFLPEKYSGYLQYLDHYLQEVDDPLVMKVINSIDKLFFMGVLLYHRRRLIAIDKKNLYIINFWFLALSFSLATRGLEELQRLGFYFSIFAPIGIPLVLSTIENKLKRHVISGVIIGVYFIYFIGIILSKNYGGIVPYRTCF